MQLSVFGLKTVGTVFRATIGSVGFASEIGGRGGFPLSGPERLSPGTEVLVLQPRLRSIGD